MCKSSRLKSEKAARSGSVLIGGRRKREDRQCNLNSLLAQSPKVAVINGWKNVVLAFELLEKALVDLALL
jgi:hypothetical protein